MKPHSSSRTLHTALLVSAVLHLALLGVGAGGHSSTPRVYQESPLDVILVNARSPQAPDQALAMAQASLDGGGEAREGRSTSPLPPSPESQMGEPLETRTSTSTSAPDRLTLLARLHDGAPPLRRSLTAGQKAAQAQEEALERERAYINLLAEIERQINTDSSQPRRRFVGPSTQEAPYAMYYDDLRRKIEERGTEQFPELNGRRLYGDLTMVIDVDKLGVVISTRVVTPSGQPELDRRAQAIVQSLEFGRFTPAMLKQAEQIVVVSRFQFTRHDTLEARTGTPR